MARSPSGVPAGGFDYWVTEDAGRISCLVEAPDAGAANEVHRRAHGLVAEQILRVSEHC